METMLNRITKGTHVDTQIPKLFFVSQLREIVDDDAEDDVEQDNEDHNEKQQIDNNSPVAERRRVE